MMRPVLFLHPFGLDGRAASWLQLPTVLSPSLPNHGGRLVQRPGLAIEDLVDEVVGWLGQPVDVVGCSMGGIVALHLALDFPEKVASLALVCTAASVPREEILSRAVETVESAPEVVVANTLSRWFTPTTLNGTPSDQVEYAIRQLGSTNRVGLAAVWRAIAEHDVRSRLHEINVPTSCIAGVSDVSTPLAASQELAEGIPGARLEEINGAHMAFLELPDQFASMIRAHLAWAQSSAADV